jgi:hypothetical protein
MIKINKSTYQYYKKLHAILWEFQAKQWGMDSDVDSSPVKVLERWEKRSESMARKGLKETLRDTLTQMIDYPEDIKTEMNKNLKQNNYPTIQLLSAQIRNTPKKVISRGKIKDDDEYYVIKEFLDDLESDISTEEREKFNEIIIDFEFNQK